jgi:hypothetical protein
LENSWSFKYIEGQINATCQHCGREISFAAKKKNPSSHAPKIVLPQRDDYKRQYPGDDGRAPWE